MLLKTVQFAVGGSRYRLALAARQAPAGSLELTPTLARAVLAAALETKARAEIVGALGSRYAKLDTKSLLGALIATLESPIVPFTLYLLVPAEPLATSSPPLPEPERNLPPNIIDETPEGFVNLFIEVTRDVTCAAGNKRVAEGAQVRVYSSEYDEQEICDEQGEAYFHALPHATYTVEIELSDHEARTVKLDASSGQILRRTFHLERSSEWDITMIPPIMDHKGWTVGAKLMREWFSRAKYQYPDPERVDQSAGIPYDDSTVTLEWVKGFDRAAKIYNAMWADAIYANEAAKKELEQALAADGKLPPKTKTVGFGDLSAPIDAINRSPYYIQQRSHEQSKMGALDDLFAALADFNLRMAVEGTVTRKGTKEVFWDWDGVEHLCEIRITKVGLYLRDSYDFFGMQPLGAWNPDKKEAGRLSLSAGYHNVGNRDFREWRDKYGCGGDFMVFSDLEIRQVDVAWELSVD